MRWLRVQKAGAQPPNESPFDGWKAALAQEGGRRCVYCALPDVMLGGELHYHIEHFVPRTQDPALARVWSNLFYACPICNRFKSDDWPAAATGYGYHNPAEVDYNEKFQVDGRTHRAIGLDVRAMYHVERLHLNREQLILARRETRLFERSALVRDKLTAFLASGQKGAKRATLLKQLTLMNKLSQTQDELKRESPYTKSDLRDPSARAPRAAQHPKRKVAKKEARKRR